MRVLSPIRELPARCHAVDGTETVCPDRPDQTGSVTTVIAGLKRCAEDRPREARDLLCHGLALVQKGPQGKGLKCLEKSVRINPDCC